MNFSREEKQKLLILARESLNSIFSDIELNYDDFKDNPNLNMFAGAFVTLTKKDELRGCVGFIIAHKPLYEIITEAAYNSALNDTRFNPITENELSEITIEISVLSPPFAIADYEEIELGKHGLILEESGRRALLLPQVPIEHNMNKEEFLSALCRKGGFNSDLWRKKLLKLEAFTADIFSENNF